MRNLIRFFSFNSFVWAAGCIVLNRRLRTPNAKAVAFDALAAFHQILHEGRPTLIEFYQQSA